MLVEKIMPKRILSGIVISSNLNKTITVNVTRRIKHKLYKKIIRQTKKYHAHDENNEFNVGDTVSIIESKPISKLKKWKVIANTGDKS
jgi:small subunit ribosomal protein S17